jgi:hypothetical protein
VEQFIGLDVSLKDTFISVREDSKRIWRGKCPSDPKLIAELIRKRAPEAKRVVFETRSSAIRPMPTPSSIAWSTMPIASISRATACGERNRRRWLDEN